MNVKPMAICVENACKTLGGQRILNDITVNFEKGKAYGIVGRNGSGKSMMFQAICGFLTLDRGRVTVGGVPVTQAARVRANLEMLASLRGRIGREDIQRTMRRVGLDPKDPKAVRKYSTGMRQRLALAQALMEEPEILILDEPMNGIDREGVEDVLAVLSEEKAKKTTILLSSHIPGDVESIADEVFLMEKGCLSRMR